MPPRAKRSRNSCHSHTNPRVILRPFLSESYEQSGFQLNTPPLTSTLFNKPKHSDVKLKVGPYSFYGHKLILCAGSEVFTKMLTDDWSERQNDELVLHEEEECSKVFERFLYYLYTGSLIVRANDVIPLFMLADKYDVKPMVEECSKIIERGLKVYVGVDSLSGQVTDGPSTSGVEYSAPRAAGSTAGNMPFDAFVPSRPNSRSSTPTSDIADEGSVSSSDAFEHEDCAANHSPTSQEIFPDPSSHSHGPPSPSKHPRKIVLMGSETFPISVVIKMLTFCYSSRITSAALYNLESRLSIQISQENYSCWNGLSADIVEQMLSDRNFYCCEHVLFKAAKAWLLYNQHPGEPSTTTTTTTDNEQTTEGGSMEDGAADKTAILRHIRYPLLTAQELYEVEKDPVVKGSQQVTHLIQEAIRYKLFQHCCSEEENARWLGTQFENRKPRPM